MGGGRASGRCRGWLIGGLRGWSVVECVSSACCIERGRLQEGLVRLIPRSIEHWVIGNPSGSPYRQGTLRARQCD